MLLHSCCIVSTSGYGCCDYGCAGGGGCGGGRSVQLFLPDVGPFGGVGVACGARRPRLFGRVLSWAAPLPLGGRGVGVIEEVLGRIVVRRASHRSCSWNWWLWLLLLSAWDVCVRGCPLLSHFCRLHLLVLLEHLLLMLMKLIRVLLHRPAAAAAAIHLVHLLLLLLMHHILLLLDLLLLHGLLVSHVGCRGGRWRTHRSWRVLAGICNRGG